jgi:HSP20 family protein
MPDTSKLPAKAKASSPVLPTLEELRRQVDHLFEDFTGGDWLPRLGESPLFRSAGLGGRLAVDLVEKDTAFELQAELPGMTAKDVDVSLRNGMVVIKGEKREQKDEKAEGYRIQERRYGAFERSFAVPEGVDTSAIEATFADGVLKVNLPKTADAQKPAQTIAIKTK